LLPGSQDRKRVAIYHSEKVAQLFLFHSAAQFCSRALQVFFSVFLPSEFQVEGNCAQDAQASFREYLQTYSVENKLRKENWDGLTGLLALWQYFQMLPSPSVIFPSPQPLLGRRQG